MSSGTYSCSKCKCTPKWGIYPAGLEDQYIKRSMNLFLIYETLENNTYIIPSERKVSLKMGNKLVCGDVPEACVLL